MVLHVEETLKTTIQKKLPKLKSYQKVTMEQKLTSKEQKVMSNKQRVTSNE